METVTHSMPESQGDLAPGSETAVFYYRPDMGKPDADWHRLRMTGIGGSEIGIIMGLSKWASPYSLWAEKTGKVAREPVTSEAAEWGNRLEPVIFDKFAECHPEWEVWEAPGTFYHTEREWQRANPDGLIKTEDGWAILEIKTAQYEDDWVNGPPPTYNAQVQWYMNVFGYPKTYFAVLFHGNKYAEYEVEASDWEQSVQLGAATMFKQLVDEDIEPDFDGAHATYETVRKMHPLIEDEAVELGDLGVHYFNAKAAAAEATAKEKELASRVLAAMGNAKRGLIMDEWKLSRQARGGGVPYLIQKRG